MRTFNHVGMVLKEKMDGMIYVEPLKVYITDCSQSPNKIEFLYFEPDTPLPQLMQQQAHIAYAVPNIEEAIKDTKLLFGPFDMGHMLLAFVESHIVDIFLNALLLAAWTNHQNIIRIHHNIIA